MEVHRSAWDGRLYGLDLARLYPPEPPYFRPKEGLLAYSVRLLRPELVAASPIPLSSDAFSGFGRMGHVSPFSNTMTNVIDCFGFVCNECVQEIHNGEVAAVFGELERQIIPQLALELNSQCASSGRHAGMSIPSLPSSVHQLSCGCTVNGDDGVSRTGYGPSPPQVGDADYLGPLVPCDMTHLNPTSYHDKKAKEKPQLSEPPPPADTAWTTVKYDYECIIRIVHSRGINMRHCGKLLQLLTCQLWRRRVLIELIARCIKVWQSSFCCVAVLM